MVPSCVGHNTNSGEETGRGNRQRKTGLGTCTHMHTHARTHTPARYCTYAWRTHTHTRTRVFTCACNLWRASTWQIHINTPARPHTQTHKHTQGPTCAGALQLVHVRTHTHTHAHSSLTCACYPLLAYAHALSRALYLCM